ncbi:putative ataxin-2, nucleotide-binding alpha-beta plait domain-containing protein [Rosa chinensis]|uniref:Putative ataxin-2, nucleotide-binding alpha-beta plait domain-containing protein n=1 Tax=Rosa chinensis TaxID=74649 RepID=A0A2P6SPH6_ROSCH|nr:polyadenylate-binding protein-interacting protein 12 isoform X1 [Rosa chinensis]XP_024178514.1 polyadenylate-binding protein-interacting protein 12 isoform X1 [Rosa chinensis]XP_024178525.1 polyadenylate-binding protein-interacting protein 12 isoform X1 [Rosa chinensis]PRQ60572.1 putative ataxin-2, nucleotide-binding alpha-beta plait domain-containing protein [Rosa chinensis]
MAVAENAPSFDNSSESNAQSDLENPPKPKMDSAAVVSVDPNLQSNGGGGDQNNSELKSQEGLSVPNHKAQMGQMQNGFESNGVAADDHQMVKAGGYGTDQSSNGDENFKRDMRDLEELLSKLNPMAQEFIPLSLANNQGQTLPGGFGYTNNQLLQANSGNGNGFMGKRQKKNGYSNQARRRNYYKLSLAQREEMIRRTVYVSDIDQQVTEENLAALFINCGQVVDCRVCGDPNSVLRFAFIEFTDEEGAMAALSLSGTMLGYYPVRVLPSKTAIAPVNPTFLPRSDDEREMCSRTIYCTNIDKKVTQADVKLFFESLCGEVQRLRLLGDYHHSTRICFVEFTVAESAIAALNCSGVVLGSLPIRVSPSKTPVRPRAPPRSPLH